MMSEGSPGPQQNSHTREGKFFSESMKSNQSVYAWISQQPKTSDFRQVKPRKKNIPPQYWKEERQSADLQANKYRCDPQFKMWIHLLDFFNKKVFNLSIHSITRSTEFFFSSTLPCWKITAEPFRITPPAFFTKLFKNSSKLVNSFGVSWGAAIALSTQTKVTINGYVIWCALVHTSSITGRFLYPRHLKWGLVTISQSTFKCFSHSYTYHSTLLFVFAIDCTSNYSHKLPLISASNRACHSPIFLKKYL